MASLSFVVRGIPSILLGAMLTICLSDPANACAIEVPLETEDVRSADLVVVADLVDYRVQSRADSGGEALAERAPGELISDFAIFEVAVAEVLRGVSERELRFTWSNSTFSLPETYANGRYLIALRYLPGSGGLQPEPGSIGETAMEPELPAALQQPCSPPFILSIQDERIDAVRRAIE